MDSASAPNAHGLEALMADLAAGFVGAKPDGLDAIIIDDLRQIAQTLQLERALILQWNTGQSLAVRTHSWLLPGDSLPETFPVAASPYSFGKLEAGEVLAIERLDDLPDPVDRAAYGRNGARSGAVIPLPHDGDSPDITRALAVASTTREFEWTPSTINSLRLFAGMVSQAMARRTSEVALQHALDEANQSRQHSSEAARPRVEVRPQGSTQIVSESAVVRDALSQIEQVAATSATVLLRGETGAGKEVFAQAIHDLSPRRRRQMITVSCAAIPTALIESELFGRERGAYTSALSRQIGRFEAANQSTLFLDEIGDLPAEMQVKLLRVLQERVIERLGSTQSIKVDVRIIAATHRDLEKAVQQGTFREDLFYRLNVFPIVVPALRDRIDDIPGLVWSFIDEFSRAFGKTITSVAPASMKALEGYPWPGNVRELRNVIERAVILCTSQQLVVPAPRASTSTRLPQSAMTLTALEVDHIRAILDSTNWRVRGVGGAAERLGLKPTTLESRMARLGIVRRKPAAN